jgi:hypothetical protein
VGYVPITRLLEARSGGLDIVRATLTIGQTSSFPFISEIRRRVNVDDVTYVTDEPAPTPAAPQVEVTSPRDGEVVARHEDAALSGRVVAPAGVRRFCVAVGAPGAAPPAECALVGLINEAGGSRTSRSSGWSPGPNTVTAWVEDRLGRAASASVRVVVTGAAGGVDLRVNGFWVAQVTQLAAANTRRAGTEAATYVGARLVARRPTLVRVFADAVPTAGLDRVRDVRMLLSGFDADGRPLPGSPLSPVSGLRDLAPGAGTVSLDQIVDPVGRLRVLAPWSWVAGGTIRLVAEVNPPNLRPAVAECPDLPDEQQPRAAQRDVPGDASGRHQPRAALLATRWRPDGRPARSRSSSPRPGPSRPSA